MSEADRTNRWERGERGTVPREQELEQQIIQLRYAIAHIAEHTHVQHHLTSSRRTNWRDCQRYSCVCAQEAIGEEAGHDG